MKKLSNSIKEKFKVIKDLSLKDKHGKWIQIEILDGIREGMRMPATEGKEKIPS